MNGEYILSKDPYNFNTLEEYIAHHFPELLEEILENEYLECKERKIKMPKKSTKDKKPIKNVVSSSTDNHQYPAERLVLIPVSEWNDYYPHPTVGAIRQLIFLDTNNFNKEVVRKIGKRIYIKTSNFFEWVEKYGK